MGKETKSRTQSEVLEQGYLRAMERIDTDFFYADLKRRALDYGYDPEYVEQEVDRYRENEKHHEDKQAYRKLMRNAMAWLYQDEKKD